MSPPVEIASPFIPSTPSTPSNESVDLDTADELALRSLLLGVAHRTAGAYTSSRAFLLDARNRQREIEVSTWIGGLASYELSVLELKEADASPGAEWSQVLKRAEEHLDQAFTLAHGTDADMASRLDSRISMLRDEISLKREALK